MSEVLLIFVGIIVFCIVIGLAVICLSIKVDRDNWKKSKIVMVTIGKILSGVLIALVVLAFLSGDGDDSYDYHEDESINEYYNIP